MPPLPLHTLPMLNDLPTHADIVAAEPRIRPVAIETPVVTNRALDKALGAKAFLKAECLQTTGSFKIRGAMNRLSQIPDFARANGVVAFSSGNHAQGIARAAKLLGMPALIVMPSDAPQIKIDGVMADRAEIRLYNRETESREEIAADEARKRGAVLVPSFDDPHIIAGQGTAGLELYRQTVGQGGPLDHIICCTGGGGLISGIALAFEGLSPSTKIWGAEPEGHDDWARSLVAGKPQSNAPGTRSMCDALLTVQPGPYTWGVGSRLLSGVMTVSDEEVKAAMRFAFRHLKLVVEPGGAAALAAALKGLPSEMKDTRIGLVLTGGNVDPVAFANIIGAAND